MNAAQAKRKATLVKKAQAKEAEKQAAAQRVKFEAALAEKIVSMEKDLREKIEEAAGEGREYASDWWDFDSRLWCSHSDTIHGAYQVVKSKLEKDGFRVDCNTKRESMSHGGHRTTFFVEVEWGKEKKEERRDDYGHGF